MKNMLQVLMYLFENYMEGNCDIDMGDEMVDELIDEGFTMEDICKAFLWLEQLLTLTIKKSTTSPSSQSFRIYNGEELTKLDSKCRGYLNLLEHNNIISPITRELIIDRCIGLVPDQVTISQLKWVTLMVLFHEKKESELVFMEHLILGDALGSVH